jgi:hypothetical protein
MDSIAVPVGLLALSACSCLHLYAKEPGKAGRIRLKGSALDDSEEDDAENNDELHANGNSNSSSRHHSYTQLDGGLDDEDDEAESEEVDDDDAASWMEQEGASEEGVPVDIEKWWYKVRLRKVALVVLLALTDLIACIAIGWNGINFPSDHFRIVEDSLMVVYWVSVPSILKRE